MATLREEAISFHILEALLGVRAQVALNSSPMVEPIVGRNLLCLVALLTAWGCSGPGAKAPNPSRPVDEGRAMKIIAQALQSEGISPAEARDVELIGGKSLRLDVAAQGRKIGVVYLTANDRVQLGSHPLASVAASSGGDLHVETGAKQDSDTYFVILRAEDYTCDDLVGDKHESSNIAAENKLERDVRDFAVLARKHKWP